MATLYKLQQFFRFFDEVRDEEMLSGMDVPVVVCGGEGSGKSSVGALLLYYLKGKAQKDISITDARNWIEHHVYFKAMEFVDNLYQALDNDERGRIILFDEAGSQLFSRGSSTVENIELTRALIHCRFIQWTHLLCVPRLRYLDVYAREERVRMLFNIWKTRRGERVLFNWKDFDVDRNSASLKQLLYDFFQATWPENKNTAVVKEDNKIMVQNDDDWACFQLDENRKKTFLKINGKYFTYGLRTHTRGNDYRVYCPQFERKLAFFLKDKINRIVQDPHGFKWFRSGSLLQRKGNADGVIVLPNIPAMIPPNILQAYDEKKKEFNLWSLKQARDKLFGTKSKDEPIDEFLDAVPEDIRPTKSITENCVPWSKLKNEIVGVDKPGRDSRTKRRFKPYLYTFLGAPQDISKM